MTRFPKGSEWRRWDLHFHTPSSYDYKDKSVSNEQIVETLIQNGISVVAVTDHHVMDLARITELQRLGRERGITVFPGIELRSELGGSEAIHFIGLFPESNINLEETWMQLQTHCKLKPSDIMTMGDDAVYVDLKETASLIHRLGGLVTIHAGKKSNSIECVTNSLHHKTAVKKEIAHCIDFFELGSEADAEGYKKHVFPFIGRVLPMIICSDNHDVKAYETSIKQSLWIKGDPTFEGLKQTAYEPAGRVSLQRERPDAKNGYEVIDKVRFIDKSTTGNDFSSDWIELNPGLNSIIGGKSSGKSLLLYQIAKTVDPVGTDNAVKHGERSVRYAYSYDIDFEVLWKDGVVYRQSDPSTSRERAITFIPQLYLNAVAEERGEDFHEVIKSILLEKPDYGQWFQDKQREINSLRKEIHATVNDYMSLVHRRKEELENLRKMGDKAAIEKSVLDQQNQLAELKRSSSLSGEELLEYGRLQTQERDKTSELDRLQKHDDLQKELGTKLAYKLRSGVQSGADSVAAELKTKYSFLDGADEFITRATNAFAFTLSEALSAELDRYNQSSPDYNSRIEQLSAEVQAIQSSIGPFAQKVKNREALDKLEKAIKAEEAKLQGIESKRKELDSIRDRLSELNLSKKLHALLDVYRAIVAGNEQYRTIDPENDTVLISELGFDGERFRENVVNRIAKRMALSKQIGIEVFDENNDFVFNESTYVSDVRHVFERLMSGELKLNQGPTLDDVVHGLLDDYFKINFDLEQHGDRLLEMSPGKRGIILFQLYLHLSNASHPILIDQPEDNLDNRTVYRELNDFIKDKKIQRQIIIVSHNANLVVSTDSEEVIVANQSGQKKGGDNRDYKFEYVTGSLEDSFRDETAKGILYQKGVREHVCEILEGGLLAFRRREVQYASVKE